MLCRASRQVAEEELSVHSNTVTAICIALSKTAASLGSRFPIN